MPPEADGAAFPTGLSTGGQEAGAGAAKWAGDPGRRGATPSENTLQHWSRPVASPPILTPELRLGAAWPLGRELAVTVHRAALRTIRRLWFQLRTREQAFAEHHGVADIPFATRGLAVALTTTLGLGLVSAVVLRAGDEPVAVASPAGAAGSTAVPGTDVPPRASVAGAAATAPGAGVTLGAPESSADGTPAAVVPGPAPNLLPTGKGMWFHMLDQAGMPPEQIVERARAAGLTHVYVRLGSSKKGFHGRADLDRLLPAAHAAGLKVVGWDFPYLHDPVADAARALEEIAYATPGGHRVDAFSADIETGSEGVALAADRVDRYGSALRQAVGPGYPLVGTVPNACLNDSYPYAEVARHFDALAPMVYWITRDPGADVACNVDRLVPLGRPVLPIGQAYDPAIDNPGLVGLVPGYDHLTTFMRVAAEHGAAGVSFWAWHTATADMWRAVGDAPWYSLGPMAPGGAAPHQVAVLQRLLNTYGYAVAVDGRYGAVTVGALAQLQADLGLPATGALDKATYRRLTASHSAQPTP